MMKRILFLSVFSFIFVINGHSRQRTEAEALAVAKSFYNNGSTLKKAGNDLTLAYIAKDEVMAARSVNNNAYYYIFNNDGNGFVIVSGDDRAKKILGYSDESAFDYAFAPDNFKYWLDCYKTEIKYLLSQPESLTAQSIELDNKPTKSAGAITAVGPLLGAIKWDQDAPYNYLCPRGTVTGCVATGMAQVMKYYNWPDKGVGSNSYKPEKYPAITVNFSQTTYDWANMTPAYGSFSTTTERNAVATLMYHCGVAVNMNYDTSANGGSGASPHDMGQGMVKYFKYDAGMQLYSRDYYSRDEWKDMIKTELNARRPILYNGNSADVGHLFVCDGYDSNDLFHMNWGWSGSSNGYFELSALNPSSLGIGGGNSGGFNFGQGITVGIQRQTTSPALSYVIYGDYYDTPENVSRTGKFEIALNNCFNSGITDIPNLRMRVELRKENGDFHSVIDGPYSLDEILPAGYGWSKLTFNELTIPNTVSNGKYRLYITFKDNSQTDFWTPRLKHGTPQYINVEVTSGGLNFSLPTENMPSLTLNSLIVKGSLYQNKTGRFTVTVRNTGPGDYNSILGIRLQPTTSSSDNGLIIEDPVVIAAGETKTFDLEAKIDGTEYAAGSYYLSAVYDAKNNSEHAETFSQLGNRQTVYIVAASTQTSALALVGTPAFTNPASIYRDNVELKAKIKNTGGYYEGMAAVLIFTNPYNGGTNLTYYGNHNVYIEKNETVGVTFKGAIDLEPGNYNAVIFYDNGGLKQLSNMVAFTLLGDSPSALSPAEAEETALYPSPAVDVLYLKSEAIVKVIRISDLSGKQALVIQPNASGEIIIPVGNLSQGTYILQSVTDEGATNYKFVKK